jgi:hypothetical protein
MPMVHAVQLVVPIRGGKKREEENCYLRIY